MTQAVKHGHEKALLMKWWIILFCLICEWFTYSEAGTYRQEISLRATNGLTTSFATPNVNQAGTVHVILRISDDGEPPLSSYRRAVVTVSP